MRLISTDQRLNSITKQNELANKDQRKPGQKEAIKTNMSDFQEEYHLICKGPIIR